MAETVLRDIGSYKNKIISYFLSSTDILTLLLGNNYTDEQVFGDDSGNKGIVYNNIFPYLFVQDTQTETKSYICIEVDPTVKNPNIKNSSLVIWAYCHKDIMSYSKSGYIGTRVDILSDMIERVLREKNIGIGKPALGSAKYFFPATNFYGRALIYEIPDFSVKSK